MITMNFKYNSNCAMCMLWICLNYILKQWCGSESAITLATCLRNKTTKLVFLSIFHVCFDVLILLCWLYVKKCIAAFVYQACQPSWTQLWMCLQCAPYRAKNRNLIGTTRIDKISAIIWKQQILPFDMKWSRKEIDERNRKKFVK